MELIGKTVNLNKNVGVFVTMNPGYAGRSNLPDNLKQLFRSVAMIKPDWELIAQVMLFSQGFQTAEKLAGRAVALFDLCDQQLSTQPHYDFGLRALKSVLVSAGNIKRASLGNADAADDNIELEVLIRSIVDTVAPKLVAADLPLFDSLMYGVFPGVNIRKIGLASLRERIEELCGAHHLVPGDAWVEKTLQLFQIQQLRHGVMMVGPTSSGKTTSWRVLLEAMTVLDGQKGEVYIIDPKAINKELLYGTQGGQVVTGCLCAVC